MRKGILTFRSSLKTLAVAVKCGMTFLQCGHPAGEGKDQVLCVREAAGPGVLPGTEEKPFQGLPSTQQHVRVHLTPTPYTPDSQGPRVNPATQTLPCVSAVSTRTLERGLLLPGTYHPILLSHTGVEEAGGWGRQLL